MSRFSFADKTLEPFSSSGEPDYICSEYGGGCTLIGATLQFEFPAEDFATDSATIDVNPPEGDQVSVDFDLSSSADLARPPRPFIVAIWLSLHSAVGSRPIQRYTCFQECPNAPPLSRLCPLPRGSLCGF